MNILSNSYGIVAMKSIISGTCFLCFLGCVQNHSPYSAAYTINFVGMKRQEALFRLVDIQRDVDAHREAEMSEFSFRSFPIGVDPIYGGYYGDWSYLGYFDINIAPTELRELINKELQNDLMANEAGSWLCFEYLRPNLQITFTCTKESLVLWFNREGIVTNQAVAVYESGP